MVKKLLRTCAAVFSAVGMAHASVEALVCDYDDVLHLFVVRGSRPKSPIATKSNLPDGKNTGSEDFRL